MHCVPISAQTFCAVVESTIGNSLTNSPPSPLEKYIPDTYTITGQQKLPALPGTSVVVVESGVVARSAVVVVTSVSGINKS